MYAPISNNISLNQYSEIEQIKDIHSVKTYPDGNYSLILSGTNQNINDVMPESNILNYLIPKAYADSLGYSLTVTDNNTKQTNTIEKENVFNANFISKDFLYYQLLGNQGGIYRFDIVNKKKDLVVYTYDTKTFGNIAFIDSINYFFIQPNTGKIGFGKVGSDEQLVLDEKALNTDSSYAQIGAYSLATISPNKQFITLIDNSYQENKKVKLVIYPSNAKTKNDIYYSTDITLLGRGASENNPVIQWSSDSKNVVAGDNANIIDVTKKEVVYTLADKLASVKLSPDNTHVFVCNYTDNECFIDTLSQNSKSVVEKDITDYLWLDNTNTIFQIGKKIYTFNIDKKVLELVTTNRGEYRLINTNKEVLLNNLNLFEK